MLFCVVNVCFAAEGVLLCQKSTKKYESWSKKAFDKIFASAKADSENGGDGSNTPRDGTEMSPRKPSQSISGGAGSAAANNSEALPYVHSQSAVGITKRVRVFLFNDLLLYTSAPKEVGTSSITTERTGVSKFIDALELGPAFVRDRGLVCALIQSRFLSLLRFLAPTHPLLLCSLRDALWSQAFDVCSGDKTVTFIWEAVCWTFFVAIPFLFSLQLLVSMFHLSSLIAFAFVAW
jgi:hypothetical protein